MDRLTRKSRFETRRLTECGRRAQISTVQGLRAAPLLRLVIGMLLSCVDLADYPSEEINVCS
jgi:hypothetical protein